MPLFLIVSLIASLLQREAMKPDSNRVKHPAMVYG